MQVDVRERIESAFEPVVIAAKTPHELLAEPYRSNEDAYELAAALFGKPWPEVDEHQLFRNREMLFALTPEVYRAYLPAVLAAILDGPHAGDLAEYLLFTLTDAKHTPAKVAALDASQRAVVREVIEHLRERGSYRDAEAALANLAGDQSSSPPPSDVR